MTFYKKGGKRLFDIIFSVIVLPILLPFLCIGAISVLLADGRPIFFKQKRVGQDGKLFTMWKFRTMYTDQSQFAAVVEKEDRSTWTDGIPTTFVFKDNADDPRITPVGRWLRKTSLDELPQIFNVIAGDMSIVGPRPETPSYVSYYSPYQMARLNVKPGITGWAQINGRSLINHGEKIECDRYYVAHYDFKMDVDILRKTVLQVAQRKGAY